MLIVLVHALHLRSLTSKAGCLVGRLVAPEEDSDNNNMAPKDTGSISEECLRSPSSGY